MAENTGKIQGKHREFKPERGHPEYVKSVN